MKYLESVLNDPTEPLIVSHRYSFHVLYALSCVFAFNAYAQTERVTELLPMIEAQAQRSYPGLEEIYLHLHTHPELSFHEEETSAYVAQRLRDLGYEVTEKVGGYGVVAVHEQGEGPTVMVRADMDGLPVAEETGLPYASKATTFNDDGIEVSVMHACGHDVHMTSLLGTAEALRALEEEWSGTLVLIFQPAEERGGGANAMLKDGLFERFPRPDYVLALHVHESIEAGKVGYRSGFAMANVDTVDIKINGIGGHGAYPHLTKDPVVLAAQIVLALQTIVSREISPTDPAVVTVGSIHGGTKHNIIGNQVDLQLTVRSYSDETRDRLLSSIERIAVNTARAAGIPEDALPEVSSSDAYTPALYNAPELVQETVPVLEAVLGAENLVPVEPVMGGEDFARYGRQDPRVPIFMYRLGVVSRAAIDAANERGESLPSLHSSRFAPDPQPSITTGVKTMTAAVLNLLGE